MINNVIKIKCSPVYTQAMSQDKTLKEHEPEEAESTLVRSDSGKHVSLSGLSPGPDSSLESCGASCSCPYVTR